MSDHDIWPLPDFNPGPHEHLHAIGVISITFASFEQDLPDLWKYFADNRNIHEKLNARNDKDAIAEFKKLFRKHLTRSDVLDAVINLIDYFDWCQVTRNQILHSARYPKPFGKPDEISLSKPIKKGSQESGRKDLSLDEIRDIAEKMRVGVVQCCTMDIYLRYMDQTRHNIAPVYLPYIDCLPPLLGIPATYELKEWPKS